MPEWVTLDELRKGAIFMDQDGVRAVKSEYRYSSSDSQWLCILLSSGEYAHFTDGNKTLVREIVIKQEARNEL